MTAFALNTVDDLWALWGALPVTRLRYPLPGGGATLDLSGLTRRLQGAVQQQCCAKLGENQDGNRLPCVDSPGRACAVAAQQGDMDEGRHCDVDWAFPLNKGQQSWRCARIFLRWNVLHQSLDVLLLGAVQEGLLFFVNSFFTDELSGHAGQLQAAHVPLAQLWPAVHSADTAIDWRLSTPWVMGNTGHLVRGRSAAKESASITSADVTFMLASSLAQRGYKLTALAVSHTMPHLAAEQVAAVCKSARDLGRAALANGLQLTDSDLQVVHNPRVSRSTLQTTGQRTQVPYRALHGRFRGNISAAAWPWAALAWVMGSGEGADEGWGALEVGWD